MSRAYSTSLISFSVEKAQLSRAKSSRVESSQHLGRIKVLFWWSEKHGHWHWRIVQYTHNLALAMPCHSMPWLEKYYDIYVVWLLCCIECDNSCVKSLLILWTNPALSLSLWVQMSAVCRKLCLCLGSVNG